VVRRILIGIGLFAVLAIVGPPLWYAVFPGPALELPPPGRRVAVNAGVELNVLEWGAGPPVVLIHGLPGSAYLWGSFAASLAARGFRVIAYDRLGYGHSDPRSDDDYTVAANGRELRALLDAMELRDVTLAGWSFGGATAITAALEDPTRIARIALLASPGLWPDLPPPSPVVAVLISEPVSEWVFAVPPLARAVQQGMGVQFFSEQTAPEGFASHAAANFALAETRRTWREEAARFRFDGPDPAPLQLPILILHGDDDRLFPRSIPEWLHERAPASELKFLPAGSHSFPVTHPDWTAREIAAFIEANP
jgi:non-heme chloroperoxidase